MGVLLTQLATMHAVEPVTNSIGMKPVRIEAFKDGFDPGMHLLPDGTIAAITWANCRKEDIGCPIVSVRFKMSEMGAMARVER